MGAKRYDDGKSPVVEGCFHYFPNALLAIGMVSKFGSDKYEVPLSEKNWLGLEQARIVNSEGRHLLKEAIEGAYDSESGLLHKAHKAWNALADLEKELMEGSELKCELVKCAATQEDFPSVGTEGHIDYAKTLPFLQDDDEKLFPITSPSSSGFSNPMWDGKVTADQYPLVCDNCGDNLGMHIRTTCPRKREI